MITILQLFTLVGTTVGCVSGILGQTAGNPPLSAKGMLASHYSQIINVLDVL